MAQADRITVEKDAALTGALERAASVSEPGTSDAALLRYLALVGADNLPEPYRAPTPEQIQRALDVWMKRPPRDRAILDEIASSR
jgi:hypothetical protein